MQHFPAHDLGDVSGTGFEHLGHVELGGEENVQIGLKGEDFACTVSVSGRLQMT